MTFFQRLLNDMKVAYKETPSPWYRKGVSVIRLVWWHLILKRIRQLFIGSWLNYQFLYRADTDGAASSYYMPYIEYPLYFLIHNWPQKRVFFDIGANIGNYTLMAAGQGYSVHAFDPNEDTLRIARINLLLNQLEAKARINVLALSRKSGSRDFYFFPINTSGLGSFLPNPGAQKRRVPTLTLDEYCESQKVTHIDLMKIDVEGAEFEVLSGAKQLLSQKAIDGIFWETGGEKGKDKQGKVLPLLSQAGFQHFHFDPDQKILRSWQGEWNCFSLQPDKVKSITKVLKQAW